MKRLTCLMIVTALAGCRAPRAELQVRRPPTLQLPPVRVLAIDTLEPATKGDEEIARYVRDALIVAINREGAVRAMTFEEAREASARDGVKVEAVLRGRVWADYVHLKGLREPVISSDVTWARTDKGIEYIAETRDKVEYQTYEIVKAFVNVQLSVVHLAGPEEKTVAALSGGRGVRLRIGGGPTQVMDLWTGRAETAAAPGERSRAALLRASVDKAVAEFTKAVSPHRETIRAVIATGGNGEAAKLIRSGKYADAISLLEPGLSSAGPDRAPDFYNLGLAYEALGDPMLLDAAIFFYRKALDAKPDDIETAEGIGRVEGMMADHRREEARGAAR
ncbi:MAG: hypothetical protein HUU15_02155 [Candidatus Brocadiae bacterium]|nr:hypothetical protein [Candidatus Brocadiia bacterium]